MEPLKHHDEPWAKVGTDLFHLNGKEYLLVIDYYSNYPEVVMLTRTSFKQVIAHIKSVFARHGIPETVVSDNIPQLLVLTSGSLQQTTSSTM